MAGYRYSPQWDQHARRNTDIVDPVLVVRPLSRFEFTGRRPVNQVDHALVFTSTRGTFAVYIPPQRPPRSELSSGRYVSVHEVDMGIHHFQRPFQLPSDNDAFTFRGELDVSWRVMAPDLVVASQLRDVPAHVVPRLEERMRVTTRRFSIEDSARAETAVRDNLSRTQVAEELGLHLTCAVRLDLDEAARNQQAALRDLGYQEQRIAPEAELERLKETHKQEMDAMRQAHRHRTERADLGHEHELLTEKARFYAWHLEQRGVVPWALEVAKRPDDLPRILEMLSKEQAAQVAEKLDLLDRVEQSGHFETYQLESPVREALRAIRSLFTGTGTDTGVTAAPPSPRLPPGTGGPDGPPTEAADTSAAQHDDGPPRD
jgi:hypothetical protein